MKRNSGSGQDIKEGDNYKCKGSCQLGQGGHVATLFHQK